MVDQSMVSLIVVRLLALMLASCGAQDQAEGTTSNHCDHHPGMETAAPNPIAGVHAVIAALEQTARLQEAYFDQQRSYASAFKALDSVGRAKVPSGVRVTILRVQSNPAGYLALAKWPEKSMYCYLPETRDHSQRNPGVLAIQCSAEPFPSLDALNIAEEARSIT